MKPEDAVRLFCLNNLLIESSIRRVEKENGVNLRRESVGSQAVEQTYYPQFTEKLRAEAAEMANHYAIFYCLENSIRDLISDRLHEEYGDCWWDKAVPEEVKKNANANQKKEKSAGVTPRSDHPIDYSNFGELGEIIKKNWRIFGDMFRDMRGLERVLGNLNTLRGPIAHCKVLAEDEVTRLHLSLRDWFRQME